MKATQIICICINHIHKIQDYGFRCNGASLIAIHKLMTETSLLLLQRSMQASVQFCKFSDPTAPMCRTLARQGTDLHNVTYWQKYWVEKEEICFLGLQFQTLFFVCKVCRKLTSGPPAINFIIAYIQISLLHLSASFAINKCQHLNYGLLN